MTLTKDHGLVDAMARATYENWIAPVRDLEPAWDDLPQSHVDRLIECQQAALDAVLPLIERVVLLKAAHMFEEMADQKFPDSPDPEMDEIVRHVFKSRIAPMLRALADEVRG